MPDDHDWSRRHCRRLSGDAAERAVADVLLRVGLVEQVDTTPSGERMLRLTADGWCTYWHHRLVIRRLPAGRHADTCPCVDGDPPAGRQ